MHPLRRNGPIHTRSPHRRQRIRRLRRPPAEAAAIDAASSLGDRRTRGSPAVRELQSPQLERSSEAVAPTCPGKILLAAKSANRAAPARVRARNSEVATRNATELWVQTHGPNASPLRHLHANHHRGAGARLRAHRSDSPEARAHQPRRGQQFRALGPRNGALVLLSPARVYTCAAHRPSGAVPTRRTLFRLQRPPANARGGAGDERPQPSRGCNLAVTRATPFHEYILRSRRGGPRRTCDLQFTEQVL